MSMEITRAIVPFEGMIKPALSIEHRGITHYNGHNLQSGTPLIGHRSHRVGRNYGRFCIELENRSMLGENIDIYV